MKKEGEKSGSYAIHIVFIALIAFSIYFIISSTGTITGHAVIDAETAKTKLESALSSSAVFSQITQASICVVINDPEQPLSLQAVKTSTGWKVSEMLGFCTGTSSEDIIIQFTDYDRFSKVVDDPSPRNIANAAVDRDFEILPSRYVEYGGNVVCDATFKVKFCSQLNTMATPDQLIDGDMVCCIDKLTSAQKKLLEQHLQEGSFTEEIGILEQPSGGIMALMTVTNIAALGGALLVIILIVVLVSHGKGKATPKAPAMPTTPAYPSTTATPSATVTYAAPAAQQPYYAPQTEDPAVTELRNYVAQAIGEGYSAEEVRAHLLEIGWDQATADKVLAEAQGQ
jgi:hypothetical protein